MSVLCRLDEIAAPGAKGFVLGERPPRRRLFVVRDAAGAVYAYENACPHSKGPLEWVPDQFLAMDRRHVQCCNHGALFRLEDGVCVVGPCVGERLTAVPVRVEDGVIVLAE